MMARIAMISLLTFMVFSMTGFALNPENDTTDGKKRVEPSVGPSGLAIPRFVSTADHTSNMRTGPRKDYPISWVFKRKGYPLEVIDEDGPWRKVRDRDGTTGWMYVKILTGKRSALIIGAKRSLYKKPTTLSRVTLIAEQGVAGTVKGCEAKWCQLEIEGTRGWIQKIHLYGVYQDETF